MRMADLDGARKYILGMLEKDLLANFYYHGLWHTKAVIKSVDELCNYYDLNEVDAMILRIAAAYHDSGFLHTYKDHEEEGCRIAEKKLPQFGYTEEEIAHINRLIMATKVPQSPHSFLEELICDADLDYLGGHDYSRIAGLLYMEFQEYQIIQSENQWLNMQISFLEKHRFFSNYSGDKNNNGKLSNLNEVKQQLISYENQNND
mgnify:CR=1 FL=1